MRILQFSPYFLPYPGGQERYVYCLSRELVRKGHQVTVITSNFPKTHPAEIVDGISVYRYPCYGRPLRNPITPRFFSPPVDLKQYDVVHTHNEHSSAAVAAAYLCKIHKIPLVITSHGKLVFGSWLPDLVRKSYWNIIGRAVLRNTTRIIVATPSERQRLVKSGLLSSQINVVPVGIDLELWDSFPIAEPEDFHKKYNILNRDILLVATQLIKRKGIQFLLEAMVSVKEEFPNIICVIAGAGDFEQELRNQVLQLRLANYVLFVGVLKDSQLAEAYQAATIFILPSLGEGQPTCIMEAWAFSKPVISTNIEGVFDYYSDSAILVESGNVKQLSIAISETLNSKSKATLLGHKGRRLVESKFQWNQVTEQIISVYTSAISS